MHSLFCCQMPLPFQRSALRAIQALWRAAELLHRPGRRRGGNIRILFAMNFLVGGCLLCKEI